MSADGFDKAARAKGQLVKLMAAIYEKTVCAQARKIELGRLVVGRF
jgi:hypothetical protein